MWHQAVWPILATLLPLSATAKDLLVFENVAPTVYYDNLWRDNGDPGSGGPGWTAGQADGQIATPTSCQADFDTDARKMSEYRSNQMVAIDRTYIEGNSTDEQARANRRKFCGKKVEVTLPNGEPYKSPGGDLFVWDGCLECKRVFGQKVDFSAPDFFRMTGIESHNIGVGLAGFKVVVTDESVIQPDEHPPDRPEGMETFKEGQQPEGERFAATAEQEAYFASSRFPKQEDILPLTEKGWTGETPAGSGNVQQSPGQYGGGPEPKKGDKGESFEADAFAQWTDPGAAQQSQQAAPSGQAGQPLAPDPPAPSAHGEGPPASGGGGGPPTDHPTDFSQKQVDNPAGGIQPEADGVAEISAGNCKAGAYRCQGNMPQVCGGGADGQIGWQDTTACQGTCTQTGDSVSCG